MQKGGGWAGKEIGQPSHRLAVAKMSQLSRWSTTNLKPPSLSLFRSLIRPIPLAYLTPMQVSELWLEFEEKYFLINSSAV